MEIKKLQIILIIGAYNKEIGGNKENASSFIIF